MFKACRLQPGSSALGNAIAVADRIVAADARPLLVYSAQHGVPLQRGAPAVSEACHDLSAPTVGLNEFQRHIVVANEYHLKPATAGLA